MRARRKRSIRLAALAVAVLIAMSALILGRATVLERVGARWLAAQGWPDASFAVARFTPWELTLHDVRLGPDAPSARRVRVRYRPASLFDARAESVYIRGLRAHLQPGAAVPVRGMAPAFSPPSEARDGGSATTLPEPSSLPEITLAGARLTAATAHGEMTVTGGARLRPDNAAWGTIDAEVRAPFGRGEIEAELTGSLTGPAGRVKAGATLRLAELPGAPADVSGKLRLTARHQGELPAPSAAPGARLARLGTWRLTATLREAAWSGAAGGVSGTAQVAVRTTAESVRLTKTGPITLDGTVKNKGIPAPWHAGFTGPFDAALHPREPNAPILVATRTKLGWRLNGGARVDGETGRRTGFAGTVGVARDPSAAGVDLDPLRLRLAALPTPWGTLREASWRGEARLAAREIAARGTLAAKAPRLRHELMTARGVAVELPLTVTRGDGLRAALREPGELTVDALAGPGAALTEPASIALRAGRVARDSGGTEGALTLAPNPLRIGTRPDGPALAAVAPGTLRLTASTKANGPRVHAELRDTGLRLPDQRVAAEGIGGQLKLPATGPPTAALSVDRVADESESARFSPVRLDARATRMGDGYRLDATVSTADGAVHLPVQGRYTVPAGSARLWLPPTPVTFAPGGLQPGDLTPMLDALGKVDGRVTLAGHAMMAGAEVHTGGRAELEVDRLTLAGFAVDDLEGALDFAGLVPPETRGSQTITVARFAAPLPLGKAKIRFRVWPHPDGGPAVRVVTAGAGLAEGRISARNILWRPGEAVRVPIHLSGISLARLLERVNVEGLDGTGTLVGTLPLRISERGEILMGRGHLRATSDGVIRLRHPGTTRLSRGGGKHVRMMLRALRDFHYTRLDLMLARPDPGALEADVGLLGNNPEVMDGHPFRFNINVQGDMRPVLDALRRGQGMRRQLLQRVFDFSL